MPPAVDWDATFLPAVLKLFSGNPYEIAGFYNAPYALFPLIPFAMLPYDMGRVLLIVCSILAMGFTLYKLGAKPLSMMMVLLSPFVIDSLAWGNLEWLTILGLAVHPALGLILLAIKPQMTIGVMLFISVESFIKSGLWNGFKTVLPLVLVFTISIMWFGLFPLKWFSYGAEAGINLSFMPYSFPIGLLLMVQAFKTHNKLFALAASPCFFSTLSPQIWMVVFFALAPLTLESIIAVLSTWGIGRLNSF